MPCGSRKKRRSKGRRRRRSNGTHLYGDDASPYLMIEQRKALMRRYHKALRKSPAEWSASARFCHAMDRVVTPATAHLLPFPVWLEYMIARARALGKNLRVVIDMNSFGGAEDHDWPSIAERYRNSPSSLDISSRVQAYDEHTLHLPIDFSRADVGRERRARATSVPNDFQYRLSVVDEGDDPDQRTHATFDGTVMASNVIRRAYSASSSSSHSDMIPHLPVGERFSIASNLYDSDVYDKLREESMPASRLVFNAISGGAKGKLKITSAKIESVYQLPEHPSFHVHGVPHSIGNSMGIEGYSKARGISANLAEAESKQVLDAVYEHVSEAMMGGAQQKQGEKVPGHLLSVGIASSGDGRIDGKREMLHGIEEGVIWGDITGTLTAVSIVNMMQRLGHEQRINDDTYLLEMLSPVSGSGDPIGEMTQRAILRIYTDWYQRNPPQGDCAQQVGPTVVQLLQHTSGLPATAKADPEVVKRTEEMLVQRMKAASSSSPGDESGMASQGAARAPGFQATGVAGSSSSSSSSSAASSSSSAASSQKEARAEIERGIASGEVDDRQLQEYTFLLQLENDVELTSAPGTSVNAGFNTIEAALLSMLAFRLASRAGLLGEREDVSFEEAIVAGANQPVGIGDELMWNPMPSETDSSQLAEAPGSSIVSSSTGAWGTFQELTTLAKSFIASPSGSSVQSTVSSYKIGVSEERKDSFATLGSLGRVVDNRFTMYYAQGGLDGFNYAAVFWVPELGVWSALNLDTRGLETNRVFERVSAISDSVVEGLRKAADLAQLPEIAPNARPKFAMPACYRGRKMWKRTEDQGQPMGANEAAWWKAVNAGMMDRPMSTRTGDPISGRRSRIALRVGCPKTRVVHVLDASQEKMPVIGSLVYDERARGMRELKPDGTLGDGVQLFGAAPKDGEPALGIRGQVYYAGDGTLEHDAELRALVAKHIKRGTTFSQSLGASIGSSSKETPSEGDQSSAIFKQLQTDTKLVSAQLPDEFFEDAATDEDDAESIGYPRGGRGGRRGSFTPGRIRGGRSRPIIGRHRRLAPRSQRAAYRRRAYTMPVRRSPLRRAPFYGPGGYSRGYGYGGYGTGWRYGRGGRWRYRPGVGWVLLGALGAAAGLGLLANRPLITSCPYGGFWDPYSGGYICHRPPVLATTGTYLW